MLSREDNELVTRSGPGTPLGKLLRAYWQPAALVSEIDELRPVKPVRLLGEDLVLFRRDGGWGLVGRFCAHRGADLAYGRLEDGGLRCLYHGWLYGPDGRCLQQPAEPPGSRFAEKIRIASYPCAERNGIVFAYLGGGEAPPFPAYDCFIAPEKYTFAFKGLWECNWLQGLEGGIDPSHVSFLHRFIGEDPREAYGQQFGEEVAGSGLRLSKLVADHYRPKIDVEHAEHGLRVFAIRQLTEEVKHVRVTNLVFPNAFVVPFGNSQVFCQWHVPIDDEHHYWYMILYDFRRPTDKERLLEQRVTFRPLPWSPGTALMLCDLRFPSGEPVPFCTRSLLRGVLSDLQARGYRLAIGAELEFHVFKADGPPAGVDHGAAHEPPGLPVAHEPSGLPTVNPTTAGGQLMHDDALDQLDELVCKLHHGLTQLDLPLRSIELEFGASQLEVTLGARDALAGADEVALCRAAIRQLCRRAGYLATFMARPAGSRGASTGWHLHQQLRDRVGRSAFTPPEGTQSADSVAPGSASVCDILSPVGGWYLGGLLAHAPAAAVFTTPTVNGYKRFRPMSLAPDRINWGIDNRGAMIRAIGGPGVESTRLENRSGEPAANPYLYVASQVVCGLDGIARRLDPGPPAEEPYRLSAPRLPRSLGEALGALAADRLFADALGEEVVAWYAALKQAEFERYLCHVSDWEQQEYLTLL